MTNDDLKLAARVPAQMGARLREARRLAGITQEYVANQLGVARTTIVAIEKGERQIQPHELIELARLYGRTANELLRPGPPASPFAVQLRSTVQDDQVLSTVLTSPTGEFQKLCEDYFELERLCNAPLPRNYPPERRLAGASPEVAGEDLAQRERLRLGLGDGPTPNLRLLLEQDVGLRVFYLKLPSSVSAMFSYDSQLGGCIAINSSEPYERRRLSLCHEYGHFLSSRTRSEVVVAHKYKRLPDHERLANSFARCFLMPSDGITRRVNEVKAAKGKFSYADICTLAHYFSVSVEAFARRLEDLRLAGGGTWERLRSSGFRINEAREILGIARPPIVDDLLPPRYRFLALQGYRDGVLAESQLARFLRLDRVEVRALVDEFNSSNPGDGGSI